MRHEKLIRKLNMIEMLVEEVREEIDVPQYDVRPLQYDSVEKMPDAVREHLFNSLTAEIDHERQVDWPQAEPPTWPDREAEVAQPDPVSSPPEPAEPPKVAEPDAPVNPSRVRGQVDTFTEIDWAKDERLLPTGYKFNASLLRQQRAREKMTQDQIAEGAGLASGSTISQLETGITGRPHLQTIKKVAEFFTIHPDRYVSRRND